MVLGRRLLEEVPQQQAFWLANGKSVQNLRQLAQTLQGAEDWVFQHHVNEQKNDFYLWVRDVFLHDELAADLLACEEKQKTVECLQHWLEQAEKDQRAQYWERVQQVQPTVTNPKLRIQKKPQEGDSPSPEHGMKPDFQGVLGFDMRRIMKYKLPSEDEGSTPPQKSTMFKYERGNGEKVVQKVSAADRSTIIKQLKEVYHA